MNTIDFSLNSSISGGNITSFNYSHSLNELVGSWSAEVANGSFLAGHSFSIHNVMEGGIIANAYKDSYGLWHLEGKDAGYRLMKSLPDIADLSDSKDARTLINYIAGLCNVSTVLDSFDGLSDLTSDSLFEIRCLISGSTCAEAILEIAMFCGSIAYINEMGRLVVAKPKPLRNSHSFDDNIINDSGSSFDLDGYATHVAVPLSYLHKHEENDDDDDETEVISGDELPTKPYEESFSGTFPNGHYSMTLLMPHGVIKSLDSTITEGNVTIHTLESHDYDYRAKNLWRDNQEFGLYALIERSYSLQRTTTGSYSAQSGRILAFEENTSEFMERTMGGDTLSVGIPDDWLDSGLRMPTKEVITRSTTRSGGKAPTDNMPPYSPPFDAKITRNYSSQSRGKVLICNETEETYEARQVGFVARVMSRNEYLTAPQTGGYLTVVTHSDPEWVRVKTFRTSFDQYDDDGKCVLSTHSEYSDNGAQWLAENGLIYSGDDAIDEYQEAYAKFSQASQGLQLSFGSSSINTAWQFSEIMGKSKTKLGKSAALGDISSWYDSGAYIRSTICPHFNQNSKSCNVFFFAGDTTNRACTKNNGLGYWRYCDRAVEALDYARKLDVPPVDAPVIGTATLSGNSSAVGYKRDVFINQELSQSQAISIANLLAQNILNVKGCKGLRKTITIPYNPSFQPDGDILEVSHDWLNLQTSITYRFADNNSSIPDFLISQSVASIAEFVTARLAARSPVPNYGVVSKIYTSDSDDNTEKDKAAKGFVQVLINGKNIDCSTKLRGLQTNDMVVIAFPAGSKLHGQIISKL